MLRNGLGVLPQAVARENLPLGLETIFIAYSILATGVLLFVNWKSPYWQISVSSVLVGVLVRLGWITPHMDNVTCLTLVIAGLTVFMLEEHFNRRLFALKWQKYDTNS